MDQMYGKRILEAQRRAYHDFLSQEAQKEGFSEDQIDYIRDLVESVEFPIIQDIFKFSSLPESLEQKLLHTLGAIVELDLDERKEEHIGDLRASRTKDLGYLILLTPESHWGGSYQKVLGEAKSFFSSYQAQYGSLDELNFIHFSLNAIDFMMENGKKVKDLLKISYEKLKKEFTVNPEQLQPTYREVHNIPVTSAMANIILERLRARKIN